ncbi:MAG: hypothetical protein JWM20_735 [Patescibacteria group bacterium]|nr:hypothetical protein [Patescibacteria group bacterium]
MYKSSRNLPTRFADAITTFVGSWTFIIIHILWFAIWIIFKVEAFPFGLLTMIVSLEAILLSTFIMISQNRQSDRDHAQAQADYETNTAAKQEIEELQERLARIEDEKLDKIIKILEAGNK